MITVTGVKEEENTYNKSIAFVGGGDKDEHEGKPNKPFECCSILLLERWVDKSKGIYANVSISISISISIHICII